ncbi:MAG: hypothetical protein QOH66_234 [Actinomycetota bacterium]|nr:hypothetical protein [Actinomycetota bacterium]
MTDATTNGLFRRLRRATSRTSPAPGPTSPTHPESWLRHASDEVLRVEDIVEPVWVIELELDN